VSIYQKILSERAPELDALHMETLAYQVGSTLNGMPKEFFDEIALLARRMGADRLAQIYAEGVVL
jgi:hypothetical protein